VWDKTESGGMGSADPRAAGQRVEAALAAAGLLAAGALWMFPWVKGVWLGYVPVGAGVITALWLRRWLRVAGSVGPRRVALAGTLALGVQVGLLVLLRPEPRYDALFVLREAMTLARTGRLSELTYYPPLQIWFYALVFRIFGPGVLAAQLGNVVWAAGTVWLVYLLGRQCGAGRREEAAALLWALYPSFLLYILVTPYYFYTYTFFILANAWLLLRSLQGGSGRHAFLAGVAGGLGALTKPVLLLVPVQALVFYLLAARRWRRAVALWAACVLGFTVILAPWSWRNLKVFHTWVPVCTSGGFVLYSANNPESNGLYSPLPDQVQVGSAAEILAASREAAGKAWEFIRRNPGKFLRLSARRFLYTWGNEATYGELVNVRGRYSPALDRVVSALAQWGWSTVVTLWLVGGWRVLRGREKWGLCGVLAAILVLTHGMVYLVFEGGARHHLPLVPLLLIVAVGSVCGDEQRFPAI